MHGYDDAGRCLALTPPGILLGSLQLIDEALAARRQQALTVVARPAVSGQEAEDTLETIQSLLLKLIRQCETSLQIQDVSLALLQDVLAEARAGRKLSCEGLSVPALREKGDQEMNYELPVYREAHKLFGKECQASGGL